MTDAASRKIRHAIMRKLQRADWALKEDDVEDALRAVTAAARLTLKLDDPPDGLAEILGRAFAVVVDYLRDGPGLDIHQEAYRALVIEGERFRPIDYGM